MRRSMTAGTFDLRIRILRVIPLPPKTGGRGGNIYKRAHYWITSRVRNPRLQIFPHQKLVEGFADKAQRLEDLHSEFFRENCRREELPVWKALQNRGKRAP